MKKLVNISIAVLSVLVLTVLSVNAQQTVYQGTTHAYQVTNDNSGSGYGYTWSEDGSNAIATPNATSTNITWNNTGAWTLTLTEANGTCTTPNTLAVTVIAAPVISFTNTTSNDCADADFSVALTYTGSGVTGYPFTVTYTDWNGTAGQTATFNDGDALELVIPAGDRADQAAVADVALTQMVITGATGPGGAITIGANSTHDHTVNDIPESNAIQAL